MDKPLAKTPRKKRRPSKRRKRRSPAARAAGVRNLQRPYVLSPELAELLQATQLSRSQVVKGIWAYARAHQLVQDGQIRSDDRLLAVFHTETLGFAQIAGLISPLLSKPITPEDCPTTAFSDDEEDSMLSTPSPKTKLQPQTDMKPEPFLPKVEIKTEVIL